MTRNDESEPSKQTASDVAGFAQIETIRETQKTIRLGIVCVSIVVSLGIVAFAVVKVLDKPPWLTALLVIIGAIFGPSGVIWVLLRSRKKYVQKNHRRIVELEKHLDLERTSSEDE